MAKKLKIKGKGSFQKFYKAENANHLGPASSDLLHPIGMMSSDVKIVKQFTLCEKLSANFWVHIKKHEW